MNWAIELLFVSRLRSFSKWIQDKYQDCFISDHMILRKYQLPSTQGGVRISVSFSCTVQSATYLRTWTGYANMFMSMRRSSYFPPYFPSSSLQVELWGVDEQLSISVNYMYIFLKTFTFLLAAISRAYKNLYSIVFHDNCMHIICKTRKKRTSKRLLFFSRCVVFVHHFLHRCVIRGVAAIKY